MREIDKQVIEAWEKAFINSHRSTTFAPSIADELRLLDIRISQLEDFIDSARRTNPAEQTELQTLAMTVYKSMLKEIEHSKRDALMNSTHGVIFSLKAVEHYEDKQTIRVEEQSLEEIIAAKTKQKAEAKKPEAKKPGTE